MTMDEDDPLVLTLLLDAASQAWLQGLRDAHFPPARNIVPAHVTLFHALPGRELHGVVATLARACVATAPGAVRLGPAFSLGRGVALRVAAPGVATLRAGLAATWAGWLTPQDRQGWRPHATVQNKVPADMARALLARLLADGVQRDALAEGVALWRYRGGPWVAVGQFGFTRAPP